MGTSLLFTGELVKARAHLDHTLALYDRSAHRPLATRFGQDVRVAALSFRSFASWFLGYPEQALRDTELALQDAREIGQAGSLMMTLVYAPMNYIHCGNYVAANALLDEMAAVSDQKSTLIWKATSMVHQGYLLVLTGKALDAVQLLISGATNLRSTGATVWAPAYKSHLARAYADLGQFDDASCYLADAIRTVEKTNERWYEPEVHRIGGEIALLTPNQDATTAEGYFQRALTVARQQQAKSWELRAAVSLARLWRSQGKVREARELLAPVYGWFTEGFNTRDLKEAKALLEELA
jgi:predicted ATPase